MDDPEVELGFDPSGAGSHTVTFGEAEYRIWTELSPTANAIFQAAEVPIPRRVSTAH
jgi:hypothetical protein